MPIKYKYRQISLKDIFSDCQDMFVDDAPLLTRFKQNRGTYYLPFTIFGAFICPKSGFICQSGVTAGI